MFSFNFISRFANCSKSVSSVENLLSGYVYTSNLVCRVDARHLDTDIEVSVYGRCRSSLQSPAVTS